MSRRRRIFGIWNRNHVTDNERNNERTVERLHFDVTYEQRYT